jgi:acetoacetate decarboxylase
MELDPTGYYRMPVIMGPLWRGEKPQIKYTHTEVIALQYLSDAAAIQALLPGCYRPGKQRQVMVLFGYNNGLDFMAGGGYRPAAVQESARFDGSRDHVEGDYILVMFENHV